MIRLSPIPPAEIGARVRGQLVNGLTLAALVPLPWLFPAPRFLTRAGWRPTGGVDLP